MALFFAVAVTLFFISLPVTNAADPGGEEEAPQPVLSTEDAFDDDRSEEPSRDNLSTEQTETLAATMRAAFEAEEAERFEVAQQNFLESYSIYPHSNLLLSLARVSAHLGETQAAIDGYQRFLQRRPNFEERTQIEARIEELEQDLEQDSRATDGLTLSQAPMPSIIGWAGIATTVVGVTGLIAGGLTASSINNDFETLQQARAEGDRNRYLEVSSDIETKQTRGKVFTYGGIGLVTAGAAVVVLDYLYFDKPSLFSFSETHAGVAVEVLGTDGAAIQWRSSF